ncbi:MYG1 family protein [Pseudooceanicola sediminis]|uniref:MYG1 family protein n=1 Tax=Pseudooceanicola sediminis TaxID=2211117 RepID=A0A399IZI4_9RHOB|nr:MYG1 family protein [Pseudooceanicola sediminis]KAA2313688.1 MYG1 family protein [Puniceibacterium sp. HSS470]RII38475.1 MYG1 family protein [Pseudooceanicola sediminis]|tara:strand:- start:95898 stop:96836 length:939 start_codon:yes stop_codon:yes gene_type:complete
MSTEFLVTHNGGFHADELLSSVVLTRLFPDAKIVRSRAPEWITAGPDRVIYDVGGHYDADARIFDHHQRNAPKRDDDQPFSSFGLIWKHFGHDYLRASGVPDAHVETVHASFDRGFVLPIDLVDNGALSPSVAGPLSGMTLPGLLETLKPVFDDTDPGAEDRAFHGALAIARSFVEARIARSAAKLRAEGLAQQAIAAAGEGRILELPMGMPFRPAVIKAGADHLLFVVTPRGKDWTLGGIRLNDEGFELRADLPRAWAGLTGEDLERVSGVEGATFCHNGCFIAAAKSRDAALAMANLAVEEHLRNLPEAV